MRKESGFTLLELLIVVVILGVLALIAAPTLLNAADRAKEGAVKANVSAAASTVTTQLTVEDKDAADAASDATDNLNNAGTTDNEEDDAMSPFDDTADAFVAASTGTKGQVSLDGTEGEYQVTIIGYGKEAAALPGATKTVSAPTSDDTSTGTGTGTGETTGEGE